MIQFEKRNWDAEERYVQVVNVFVVVVVFISTLY